jgi:outer membrane lipoprotein-sorting protein
MMSAWSVLFVSLAHAGAAAPALDPAAILDRVDDLYRANSSHGVLTMKVVTSHWSRALELEVWSKGKDESLIRITSPAKERGTTTLKVGANIWNYLPNVKRVVKVPSSMMGGSWMGSHFTNDDLVKVSRMSKDYDVTVDTGAPADRVVLLCTPKENAAVVWGKLVVSVRRADLMPLSIVYYDEHGKLARTLTFSDVTRMGGREIPAVTRMVPADKPGESTEIRYQSLAVDVPLPADLFSLRSLQR